MILSGRALRKSNMAFKKNKKPWYSQSSKLSHFDYYWFKKKRLTNSETLKIEEKLLTESISIRNKILLEDLLNKISETSETSEAF